MSKQNWFNTLAESLASEGLGHTWEVHFPPIGYGQTYSYIYDDGTKYGRFVSIYRDDRGMYERAISYSRN